MKKRFDKLLLCGLIICSLAVPTGFAEGDTPTETQAPATQAPATQVPTSAPTQEPTSEPTQEPASEPTQAPTSEPTQEPTSEPTQEPTSEPTQEPTSEPTQEPSSEPSQVPTPEITPEPSLDPSQEPTAEPSLSPSPSPSVTPMPQPGSIDGLVTITPEGDAQEENGVWRIRLSAPDSPLSFTWTVSGEAQGYLIYKQDAQGSTSLLMETGQTRIDLSAADYASGQYTLFVGAVLADGSVTWGKITFELASQQEGFPGGFPGGMGGFPSGGMPSGAAGAAAGRLPEEEQGFRVTPGEALTSKHASGSMDTTAYTHSNVESSAEPIITLVLDSTQAEITLDGGASAFTSSAEDGKLILTPASEGEAWNLSALAMNTLHASGIDRVEFHLDGSSWSLPTQMEFCGSVYAALRAQGYVSKDMTLRIDAQGLRVQIAGGDYSINESGELVPLEG